MASNSHDRRNHDRNDDDDGFPPPNHSIPLEDLSHPAHASLAGERGVGRRGGATDGFFSRRSIFRRGSSRDYENVANESPSEPQAAATQSHSNQRARVDDGEDSIDDPSAFAFASVGLNFGPTTTTPPSGRHHSLDEPVSEYDTISLAPYGTNEPDPYYSLPDAAYEDTAPLTDQRNLQPISGTHSNPSETWHTEAQSTTPTEVHFNDGPSREHSRLGDNLPHVESGLAQRGRGGSTSTGDRSRSASPSALERASSMMKSMSQRVVNLSNEPEVVEQAIQREESYKNSRMEEPPSLPTLPDYAHDAPSNSSQSGDPDPVVKRSSNIAWREHSNPLRGKSVWLLSPHNPIRTRLCDILVHSFTEPFILLVIVIQMILLTIESAKPVEHAPRGDYWGQRPIDYCYLVIFVIYTAELIAKILVSGFVFNPPEYSTLDRSLGFREAVFEKGKNLFTPQRQFNMKKTSILPTESQASVIRTFTGGLEQQEEQLIDDPLQRRRIRLAHRAFLRHSFNRLDFVAVAAFWISFILSLIGLERSEHIYVFHMLSCLRLLRLLALTNGTSVILRSLKKAAPLLVHVGFLICFLWLLFAIIGVQSFKSSLKRTCVWQGVGSQNNYTLEEQFCGGHKDTATGTELPWIRGNGDKGESQAKGYICPRGSFCVENTNPSGNTVSFDNIINSLELVFVIMSSNTFTDILYQTTDSDYLSSALFFAVGFVILSLWMVNLLVAVITHTFQVIREESKRSAFAVQKIDNVDHEDLSSRKTSTLKHYYDKTEVFWVLVIAFGLVAQALRSASMSEHRMQVIDTIELIVTLILLAEIILRFASDWRRFHKSRRNWFDLGLVIITCIIQIPMIKDSGRPYSALTLFQILRVYRVVLAIPMTRDLIMDVFRNVVGLINLIIFVFLITFLAAIFAAQLFRGEIDVDDDDNVTVSFSDIYISFLGMYQILSSEDWTSILFKATESTTDNDTAWISAVFLILWFVVANFIILNMFIAVIQESFDVSEDEKRLQQVRAFLEQKQLSGSSQGNLALSKIFRFGRNKDRFRDPLDHGPAALDMLLEDAIVGEFLDENHQEGTPTERAQRENAQPPPDSAVDQHGDRNVFSQMWTKTTNSILRREPNPFYSKLKFSRAYEEMDPKTMAQEVVSAAEERKVAQRKYLAKHPYYNKALFIFAPDNPVRKLCQRIVGPGRGNQRVEGVDPYKPVWYAFSAFIYAAIVAMVVLACYTTPMYQRTYFLERSNTSTGWFVYTDMSFAIVFTAEAVIKVIADGFFWTPNAYFRGSWGFIDGVVLITLWINVVSSLKNDWGVSRAIGAFKALRALRLLNVSDSAKDTFHSVIIVGGWKVISAAAVSMSFLVPFAIYAVNLFNGQMVECNDDDISGNLTMSCVDEYMSEPFNWEVLAPRAASNPYYDFDNFGNALFILFQIVSQEGWTDVQSSAMNVVGKGLQPEDQSVPENGMLFVVFNLLGSVFVLTLFVSVFMRNYTEQTGVAFLTAEQRSWLELRKHLRQVSPSKRSFESGQAKTWRVWCYRIAVKKYGRWARCVTTVLLLHLLLLLVEFYGEDKWWEWARNILLTSFNVFYLANLLIRMIGLGWHRFSRSSWDLYSLIVVPGTVVTAICHYVLARDQALVNVNKVFLVSITLLLIPRNNQLDQLFKTAAASLTTIGNLLATWFVMFLVYAIAMNQAFGLTKFGGEENNNMNFRDVQRSLILLFRMSCGEGWNEIMEDFATMRPPRCTYSSDYFQDDCGSAAWARSLFISWNIISMYIFVSLFVSLIFESFSYVYQQSSGLYVVSRDEIRRFKQAWATFDPDGTGFITKEQFPRLLGELSGVFEMRIYDGDFTIGRILDKCRVELPEHITEGRRVVEGVDIDMLSHILRRMPVDVIQTRRERLNTFYEEMLVSADAIRGISFHSCLMILAHHNVINDSKSLRLEEFLRRRARLQRVEEAVRRNTVIGFFDTLYWSREFRRKVQSKKSARLSMIPQFTVPEIFVDGEYQDNAGGDGDDNDDGQSDKITRQEAVIGGRSGIDEDDDDTKPMLSPSSLRGSGGSGDPSHPQTNTHQASGGSGGGGVRQHNLPHLNTNLGQAGRASAGTTPTGMEWSAISPSLLPSRGRARTVSSYDPGPTGTGLFGSSHMNDDDDDGDIGTRPVGPATAGHSRQNSGMSVTDVMHSFDNSAWGESLRRSFTQRRSGDHRRSRE